MCFLLVCWVRENRAVFTALYLLLRKWFEIESTGLARVFVQVLWRKQIVLNPFKLRINQKFKGFLFVSCFSAVCRDTRLDWSDQFGENLDQTRFKRTEKRLISNKTLTDWNTWWRSENMFPLSYHCSSCKTRGNIINETSPHPPPYWSFWYNDRKS